MCVEPLLMTCLLLLLPQVSGAEDEWIPVEPRKKTRHAKKSE